MCGVAGVVERVRRPSGQELRSTICRMADTLAHRGPDAGDVWTDEGAGVALGHRRLAIVDLSPAGAQPMISSSGRYVIVYNGEMYGTDEVRAELERAGVRFRGHSDTEILLEACQSWGVRAAVPRFNGIFAFAVWDRRDHTLWLVRDRLGVKPLYWMWTQGRLLFGSELKALAAHPDWRPEIDRDALASFFRHGYVPGPHTIFRGARKLQPGTILELAPGMEPRITQYWDLRTVARKGLADRISSSDRDAVDELEHRLLEAVGRQMVADVPLGAFLSGGTDSSTIVALMQAQSGRPVRTFSIGFHEAEFDEARNAKAVAAHLGTDHTEFYVEPRHALDLIPDLPTWFDEPFADSSQIPTLLVSEMTRRHVTVALSGDGGDELFAGYDRYGWAERIWNRLGRWPEPLRHGMATAIQAVPPQRWDALSGVLPPQMRPGHVGDRLHKLADLLPHEGQDGLYRRLLSVWPDPARLVPGAAESKGILWDEDIRDEVPNFVERMQFLDTVTYLPDDILTKVDRASMATSLEARVPLLDHTVVEFSWRLPPPLKIRHGSAKWLLRQVLNRHVPETLTGRRKMGFRVPIKTWLRGPLRDWAETLLSERCLREGGLLEPGPIRRKWAEHLSGGRNWQHHLWIVLMFQAWHECWMKR